MKKQATKQMLSLLLVIALLAGIAIPVNATPDGSLDFAVVNGMDVPQDLLPEASRDASGPSDYADTDIVRVSILLDRASTVDMGYSTLGIAQNAEAMRYRGQLKEEQISTTAKIEKVTGEPQFGI